MYPGSMDAYDCAGPLDAAAVLGAETEAPWLTAEGADRAAGTVEPLHADSSAATTKSKRECLDISAL